MINRFDFKPFLLLVLAFVITFFFPRKGVELLQGVCRATMMPSTQLASIFRSPASIDSEQLEALRFENQQLSQQLKEIRDFILQDPLFEEVSDKAQKDRLSHMMEKFSSNKVSLVATLIYREPSSWNSFIWVNVGTKDNEKLGRTVVAKHSPVVIGDSVIGAVEWVGKTQSKIRLITDSSLSPSVRVLRGDQQLALLGAKLSEVIGQMSLIQGLFFDEGEKDAQLQPLIDVKNRLVGEKRAGTMLAKGVVRGMSYPLWRAEHTTLKGSGFNYDFSDDAGPARELRTGKILGKSNKDKGMPLIEVGDLLITTGLDGVFPPGFAVGYVSHISRLKEGNFSYDIEATLSAGSLRDIAMVWILPPMQDPEDL